MFGHLNLESFEADGLIDIPDLKITKKYSKSEVDNQDCIFIGQDVEGAPNGFVRVIYDDGSLYEGYIDDEQRNGFGRYICQYSCYMGWWQNGELHGNCRLFDESKGVLVKTNGWFDNGTHFGPFREQEKVFKYWEFKEKYFIRDASLSI